MYANFNIEDNQFMRMKMIADQNDPNVKMPTMFPYASDRTDGKVIPGHSTTSLPTSTCRPVR